MRFKVAVVLRLLSFHCLFLQINTSEQIIRTVLHLGLDIQEVH